MKQNNKGLNNEMNNNYNVLEIAVGALHFFEKYTILF